MERIKYWFVKQIYADHNKDQRVLKQLNRLVAELPEGGKGLNIGAGKTRIDPRILNMEIEAGPGIDVHGSVEQIPLEDDGFDLVICQEVLEHVEDPNKGMREIWRVLKPGGKAYIQLPFVIGYHPCPKDYWRFTNEGIALLATKNGLYVNTIGISVGPAVGFYRILIEFVSTLFGALHRRLYYPTKICSALLFYPVKFLDPLMSRSDSAHRIPGGYYMICSKN